MTPEQQRIAIAEACGWKRIPADNVGAAARLFYGDVWWRDAENNTVANIDQLPNYPFDLNAMHAAEKILNTNQAADYCELLRPIICGCWRLVHATAAQRAEAFLRTLKLWTTT